VLLDEAQARDDLLDARLRERTDAFAEPLCFGNPPSPGSSSTFPGSHAFARFIVSAQTTTVAMSPRLMS
jgi:hypothetical protein